MNKTVLINYKQHKFLKSRAKYKTWIGGRGSGKTTVVSFLIALLYNAFPKAICILAGNTYAQLDSTVIAALSELKDSMGITEWSEDNPSGDYVIGKCPPPEFDRPYKFPGRKIWENCVFFRNGFTIRLVSQTRKATHRGINADFLIIEEAAIVEYGGFVEEVLLPALRSPVYAPYFHHPWRNGVVKITSAPTTSAGNWVFDDEKAYHAEMNNRAKMDKKWQKANPPTYLFLESTSADNHYFLGSDYTTRLKATMDPWKFNVEVMNERVSTLPNAYYHAFSDTNISSSNMEYVPEHPISVTLDFNTDIVWNLIFQTIDNEERNIATIFKKPKEVKTEQKVSLVKQAANEFCERYALQGNSNVYVFGDPNGNSTGANTDKDNKPFFDDYVKILKDNGFVVHRRELTSYPPTKLRYDLVNKFCSGNELAMPIFRTNSNNIAFITAIRATPVRVDKSFRKDKSSEKKARMREHATDSTDALDYYVWAKYSHLVIRKKRKDSGMDFR
jgi:hypothetical protein